VALSWQISCKPIASLLVRSRPSSANVQSGCQPLPQAATPMSHKVERLHAYPRAVCKRALLPTCCSDTPPTLFANRRLAAEFMVIQVRSGAASGRRSTSRFLWPAPGQLFSPASREAVQDLAGDGGKDDHTPDHAGGLRCISLPGGVRTCRRLCGRGTRRRRVGGDDNERRHRLEESHRRGPQDEHRQGYCLLPRCAGSADARRQRCRMGDDHE
jgi:hypothetical protein